MRYRAWAGVGTALLLALSPTAAAYSQTPSAEVGGSTTPTPSVPVLDPAAQAALQRSISGSQRIEPERDQWRNPAATLQFFGVRPTDTVIEIWPGQGWYTSILGAYLKQGSGKLIVGHWDANTSNSSAVRKMVDAYRDRFEADQGTYGSVNVVPFGPWSGPLAKPNSVDSVLTFRNVHNWMADGWAEKAFGDFFLVLKPGGILGIEEHRGRTDEPQDPLASDGYVREDFVIQLALEAGFEFIGRSEINANPADTKDHPFGVWTLPPVSRTSPIGQPDDTGFVRTRFDAIGESDRMTLRFRKPINPSVTMTAANSLLPTVVIKPASSPPQAAVGPSTTVISVPAAPRPVAPSATDSSTRAVSPPPPAPVTEPRPTQPNVGPPLLPINVAAPPSPPPVRRTEPKAPPVAAPRPQSARPSQPATIAAARPASRPPATQPTEPPTPRKLRPTQTRPKAAAHPPAATKAPATSPKVSATASAPKLQPKVRPIPRSAPPPPARQATRPTPPPQTPKAKAEQPLPPVHPNKPDWVVPRKRSQITDED